MRVRAGAAVSEEVRKKAKALVLHRWNVLRSKVAGVTQEDFMSVVSNLWSQVLQYSTSPMNQSAISDSTTDFVVSSWARRHSIAPPAAGSSGSKDTAKPGDPSKAAGLRQAGKSGQPASDHTSSVQTSLENRRKSFAAPSAQKSNSSQNEESMLLDTNHLGRGIGLEGLSLDTIPNCSIGRSLMLIAKGLLDPPRKDDIDFFTLQVHLNRGWKLILLGLMQAESFSRHVAMIALNRSLPVIKETLVDSITRFNLISILVNLVVSDERHENRLKAVYLIGQMGAVLAPVREYHQLMLTAFKELSRKLLEIQYADAQDVNVPEHDGILDMKVHLFQAIGKFTHVTQKKSNYIEDLVLYMIYRELKTLDEKLKYKESAVIDDRDKGLYVVFAILGILNNE
eukprot:jgi/Hompol1/2662/HPOL_006126-RA